MLTIEALPSEGVSPRKFCQAWFGLSRLTAGEIADHETHVGYRGQCIKLLSQILGVTECSVRKWGSDLNFSAIPEYHKLSLAYALQAANMHIHSENKAA